MKYLLICAGLLLIVFHSWGQERLADRIAPPSGYVRETCSDNSFTTYLRNLPLLPKGSKVLLYNGKEKAIGFLVGQTMKAMKGKANPGMVNQILKELL